MDEVRSQQSIPMRYEIRLKGQFSEQWSEWFDGMIIAQDGEGNTTLTGSFADQAALHGMLDRALDFGILLLSVKLLNK